MAMETDAINEAQHVEMPRTILAGVVDSQSPAKAPTAHLLMQIRHNLVVPEKPFFRLGCCVLKTAHHFEASENIGFFGMKRSRLPFVLNPLAPSGQWPPRLSGGA